jgi:hypothetical protein
MEPQHGAEPGKHVSDEAFALLHPNVLSLLGELLPPPAERNEVSASADRRSG